MYPVIKTRKIPSDISGLSAWFDANDLDTITKDLSNNVSQWDDKSTKSNNVTQGTASKQPLWIPNSQNGKPGIQFDATNAQILLSGQIDDTVLSNNGYTMFIACKSTVSSVSADNIIFQVRVNNANASPGFRLNDNSPDVFAWQYRRLITYLSGMDIDRIEYQTGDTRIYFNGTPNLSGLALNDVVLISGATNASNNGQYRITAVNDGLDYIDIDNPNRTDATDDEASDSPAIAISYNETGRSMSSNGYSNVGINTDTHIHVMRVIPIAGDSNRINSYCEYKYNDFDVVHTDTSTEDYYVNNNPDKIAIGGHGSDGLHASAIIYEIIIYNRYLMTCDQGLICDYLEKKWGL